MRRKKKWMTLMTVVLTGTMLMAGGCGTAGDNKTNEAGVTSDASAQTAEDTAQKEDAAESDSVQAAAGEDIFKNMKTTDLNGEEVDAGVFAENKLTVVNVWGTWCTPCVDEIPELEEVSKAYEGKGVAIKGLLYEMEAGISDETRAAAEDILAKAGANYQQLVASEEMHESALLQNLQAFPTTYFVDSEGNIIGQVEGSMDAQGWMETIDEYLEEADGE